MEKEIGNIKSTQQNLEKSLTERELLIKEIHHRVKNNMQVITSLINLRLNDKNTEVLPKYTYYMKDLMNKIRSMAIVHEVVDESSGYEKIDIIEYVRRVSELSFQEYDVDPDKIRYRFGDESMHVDLGKGILCGLIVHELVTNAITHGFNEKLNGDNYISIAVLKKKQKPLELIIEDNGIHFNEDFELETTKGFGLGIIESLVEQLDGTLSLDKAKKRYFLKFSLNGQA